MSGLQEFLTFETLLFLGIVAGLLIAAVLGLVCVHSAVSRDIRSNEGRISEALRDARESGPRSSRAARLLRPVVALIDERLPGADGSSRWLVHGDVVSAYGDACSEALRGRNIVTRLCVGAGESLTGIALIFTFSLIAYVLATDVPLAIMRVAEAGDQPALKQGNEALSHAVRLMGVKFSISAFGLLGALVFRVFDGFFRHRTVEAAHHSIHGHAELFVSRETHRFEVLRHDLADMTAAVARNERAIAMQTQELSAQLGRLASIEVSVKDVGNEVQAHIGTLMKSQVADQICNKLTDVEELASKLAQDVERGVAEITSHHAKGIQEALLSVRDAVKSQGQGEISVLIEKMRDMMTGGFQSESQGMVAAMGALRDTLPQLQSQLQSMAEAMSQDAQRRRDEGERAQTQILGHIQASVRSSQEAQATSQAALSRLLEAAESSTSAMQDRISRSGEEAVEKVIDRAARGFGDLRVELETLKDLASGNVGTFNKQMDESRQALSQSTDGLKVAVQQVRAMAESLRGALEGTVQTSDKTRLAIDSYTRASHSIQLATQRFVEIQEGLDARLRNEQSILAQQKEFVERSLPALLAQYVKVVDQEVARLQEAWNQLAQSVDRTVRGSSSELASSVDEFGGHVEDLKKALVNASQR